MAEWWYNTTYHTSLKIFPFQALYGYPPRQISELSLPCSISEEARVTIVQKEDMSRKLKQNLSYAQERMKYFADRKRYERTFEVGDQVYLKMQPYRQNAFGLRGSLKLRSKYYGPIRILEKVGRVAYRLLVPDEAEIYHVFHVSQLKKYCGGHVVPLPGLPLVNQHDNIKTELE
ncbi:uncharacterized protein LOC133920794 [Phragmites australis]|uniref:uncharacterized protein LOC133920794 n=1 Tax=Phragmites australis TaxID=29695 RepID=UPI002D78A48D|nr:uncharacterized protein LOC133920794 [Phragmites australis]